MQWKDVANHCKSNCSQNRLLPAEEHCAQVGFGHIVHRLFSQALFHSSQAITQDAPSIAASLTRRSGGRSSLFCFRHLPDWASPLAAAKLPCPEPPNGSSQCSNSTPQLAVAGLQPSARRTSPGMLRHTSAYQLDQKACP